MSRQIKIEWGKDGPEVGHLSGPEARNALRQMMIEAAREQHLRIQACSLLASLVYRDASRGLCGPDGEPVMPMRLELPAELAAVGRRPWAITWKPVDGGMEIVVEPDLRGQATEGQATGATAPELAP